MPNMTQLYGPIYSSLTASKSEGKVKTTINYIGRGDRKGEQVGPIPVESPNLESQGLHQASRKKSGLYF